MVRANVYFQLLGNLELSIQDRVLDLGPEKQRAVLAMVLLERNRPLARDRLVEGLWAGRPPRTASETVRCYVSRLRRLFANAIGSEESPLSSNGRGYVLTVLSEQVDVDRFEGFAAQGRSALLEGAYDQAAASFAEGLALWRGSALADLAHWDFARAEAARLEELRLVVTEQLIEAELAQGRHADVLPRLDALVKAHPLREQLREQLMLALYRSGRQAEALRAYRSLLHVLREELGIEPTPRLRALEGRILRQDFDLDWKPPHPGRVLATGSRYPLPALLDRHDRTFQNRHDELQQLQRLWWEAASGGLRLAFVTGEPGVGKTRLAVELARRVQDAGGVVLAGRCDEDLAVPFQPFAEALDGFLRLAPADRLREQLGEKAGELVRLAPQVAERLPDVPPPLRSDPETESCRLFQAVAAWLAAVSTEAPVLFVLDDLNWAIKPTLLMLRHVVRTGLPMRLLVVGCYRDSEPGPVLAEALADLHRDPGLAHITLGGLDESAVIALMSSATGHESDVAVARRIHAATSGNPFFIKEMVRLLAEKETVTRRREHWTSNRKAQIEIPEAVRAVVRDRISRLSPKTQTVLGVAAVIGDDFDAAVLQLAADETEETVLAALEESVSARLIIELPGPPPLAQFAHAVVRHVLYLQLLPERARRLHHRVGEAIEAVHRLDLQNHLQALTHHFAEAGLRGGAKAISYAAKAGDRARERLAHEEAVSYYQLALNLLPSANGADVADRREFLLLRLDEAIALAADERHRETLFEAAHLARE